MGRGVKKRAEGSSTRRVRFGLVSDPVKAYSEPLDRLTFEQILVFKFAWEAYNSPPEKEQEPPDLDGVY